MTRVERVVATPHGDARLVTVRARSPVATLLLSHGAGNGIDTRDLEALAHHLPRNGVTVVPDRPTTSKTRIIARSQQVVRIDDEVDTLLDGSAVPSPSRRS